MQLRPSIVRLILCSILLSLACQAWAGCSLSDIRIQSVDLDLSKATRFQTKVMKVRAMLVNGCSEPIGMKVKLAAYDKTGRLVSSRDGWIGGDTRYFGPGKHTFSLDNWLDNSAEIQRVDVIPIELRSGWAGCLLSDIRIQGFDARFERHFVAGFSTARHSLKGIGTLTNRCANAIGIKVKLTAYDKTGKVVSSNDGWAGGLRQSIPPGNYPFSLDNWLNYSPEITKFDLTPTEIRVWR